MPLFVDDSNLKQISLSVSVLRINTSMLDQKTLAIAHTLALFLLM